MLHLHSGANIHRKAGTLWIPMLWDPRVPPLYMRKLVSSFLNLTFLVGSCQGEEWPSFHPLRFAWHPLYPARCPSVPRAISRLEIMRDNGVTKCLPAHNSDERWSRLLFHLIACQRPEASAVSFLWILGSKAFCGAHLSEFPQFFQFLHPSVSCWKNFL